MVWFRRLLGHNERAACSHVHCILDRMAEQSKKSILVCSLAARQVSDSSHLECTVAYRSLYTRTTGVLHSLHAHFDMMMVFIRHPRRRATAARGSSDCRACHVREPAAQATALCMPSNPSLKRQVQS